MDAHKQVTCEAEVCFAVLGRAGQFCLIDTAVPLDDNVTADANPKGYYFCGAFVVRNGVAGAECDFPNDPDCTYTMLQAALGFARCVATRLVPNAHGDAVVWLNALYALPDAREAD